MKLQFALDGAHELSIRQAIDITKKLRNMSTS